MPAHQFNFALYDIVIGHVNTEIWAFDFKIGKFGCTSICKFEYLYFVTTIDLEAENIYLIKTPISYHWYSYCF